MNLHALVTVALRILALVALLYWLRDMAAIAGILLSDEKPRPVMLAGFIPQLSVSLFWLVSAGLLWRFAKTLAEMITQVEPAANGLPAPLDARELEVALLLVLGCYLLFGVLSDLAYWLGMGFLYQRDAGHSLALRAEDRAAIFATVVELLFAIVLILRARGVVGLVRRLRR